MYTRIPLGTAFPYSYNMLKNSLLELSKNLRVTCGITYDYPLQTASYPARDLKTFSVVRVQLDTVYGRRSLKYTFLYVILDNFPFECRWESRLENIYLIP